MMKVSIELLTTSKPLHYKDVENTYTKGGMYCIYLKTKGEVIKIPLCNIFRANESY